MQYKAVIFDLGGVVFGSPIEGVNEYERLAGLPKNFINIFIVCSKDNAFKKLERGQLNIAQFQQQFKKELDDPKAIDIYIDYMEKKKNIHLNRHSLPQQGFDIDTVDLFTRMNTYGAKIHQQMLHCIFMLRLHGYITIALTNNFSAMPQHTLDALLCHFDAVLQSAVIGMRKPNPKIFQYALHEINQISRRSSHQNANIAFENVVFLDDIGVNLKSAANLGIKCIKVGLNQQNKAIMQLNHTLDLQPESILMPTAKRNIKTIEMEQNIKVGLNGCASNPMLIVLSECIDPTLMQRLTENEEYFIVHLQRVNRLNLFMQRINRNISNIAIVSDQCVDADILARIQHRVCCLVYLNVSNVNKFSKIPTLCMSDNDSSDMLVTFVNRSQHRQTISKL